MTDTINRRHFLAASAAGVALAGTAAGQDSQGANQKLLVGVMGTGGRGLGLATSFQRQAGVEVAYVCDCDQTRAERAAAAVQKITNRSPRVVTDFRRILDDKAVDILVVATCNHWHAPAAILGCAANKHVYVEKPCSYNPREGELLVQAARKNKRHVQMGNQRRSWPKVIEGIEEVRKGAIGRAYFAQAWYINNRPSIGRGKAEAPPKGLDYDMWQGPAPRRPFHSNYLHYNWHWFWHWGNGELGNNGIHMIDVCRWGLGVDAPVRVTSAGGRYRFEDDQETPDTQLVSYEFEGRKAINWEGLSCSRLPAGQIADVVFHGETGTLAIRGGGYTVHDVSGKELRRERGPSDDALHLANFLNGIRTGARLNSEIEEGAKSTLLCHLGNIAHRTGRALQCDPKTGHIQGDKAAMAYWTREYEKGWEPRV
ncbi:MAG TPA: Gfo/Idh/MocA family oxidoreductase [Gemmataceae bacterium]|nr:Gfo/Idh/MocA family oxidoreductase [Gemmataceae bacterium]